MRADSLDYPLPIPRPRRSVGLPVSIFLAWKDIWRNKGRYFLIGLVVALITTLVLFIAGLAEGLGAGNREYIEKLDADVVLFQANVDLSIPSSRLGWSKMREVRRVPGVTDAGFIGFSNVTLLPLDDQEPLKVSLIGVEPGRPGAPPAKDGVDLMSRRAKEVVIDANVVEQAGINVGDTVTIKSVLGADEDLHDLLVVGVTDSRKYSIQPSIFVPYQTWEQIKPKAAEPLPGEELVFNLIAVQSDAGIDFETMQEQLELQVSDIEAVDIKTAYENTPGYSAQQSTLNTQQIFTLIIGVLVLGGFFQIQTLQKVAQIGMLKAIGTSSMAIIIMSIIQIVAINAFGVVIGALGTYGLTQILPPGIPIAFRGDAVSSALISLLLIGPIGGIVSIITLLRAEPLKALGLAS
jgi:putative ABC transport system permease protein